MASRDRSAKSSGRWGSRFKGWAYRIPGDQGVGLQGPRESRGLLDASFDDLEDIYAFTYVIRFFCGKWTGVFQKVLADI